MVEKLTHEGFDHITAEKYQLENLINMDDLKKILEDFHRIAPFPVAVLNLKGDVLLESHWEPICTQFHRVNPKTAAICTESDIHFNAALINGKERQILYRCGNGLYDAASPIIIEGQHLGNLFIGQFLLEPADEGFFRKQAQRYGFEEEEYLEALSRVPIISEHNLKNGLGYLCGFAEFLGNIGLKEFQRNRAEEALRESEAQLLKSNQLLTGVLEHTHMMAVFLDSQFNFIWVNRAYADTCKLETSFFPGKNHFDLYPHEENRVIFQRVVDTGEPFFVASKPFEFPDQPERGVTYWDWSLIPVEDGTGKVTGLVFTLVEVTERIQAEQALLKREELHREAQRVAHIGHWELFPEIGTPVWSDEIFRIFGLNPQEREPSFTDHETHLHPDDWPLLNKAVTLASTEGTPFDIIFRIVRPDGEIRWMHAIGTTTRDEKGKVTKLFGTGQDITDLKRAQEALLESETRYKSLVELSPEAVFVHQDGVIVYINPAGVKIFGATGCEEIIGKPALDFVHPDYLEITRTRMEQSYKDRTIIPPAEFKYVRFDKKVIDVIATGSHIDYLGKPSILSVIRDITAQKIAETALRESKENLDKAQEIAHIGSWTRDLKLDRAQWSDEMFRILGLPPGDLTEISFETVLSRVHPEDRERVSSVLKEAAEKKQSFDFEFRTVPIEGSERIIRNRGEVEYDESGNPVRFFGTDQDITETRILQARLLASQKTEAIATLAGGIAHNFNNALTPVIGNVDLLQMEYGEDEETMACLNDMKTSSLRMVRLTRQLLAYAKGGKYNPQVLSLGDIVDAALTLIKHTLDPAVRVETDLLLDVMNVKADETQMQMVFSAIMANSNEAMEGPGRIRISTGNTHLDNEFIKDHPGLKPGSYACLSIEDDGKGMDEETRRRIFDPFFTTHFMGRGLGMAAVSGVIKNHNGAITVDSEPGKGTVVRIYLPAISAESREQEAKAAEEAEVELAMGEGTVLVIEDEELLVGMFREMLEMLGYRVLVAETGKQAVELARTFDGRIDLALLDIKLPDMDGGRVYPLIMEARPDLKVVICSGYSIDGPTQAILDAGAEAFIQKPFSIAPFAEKLKEVLEGE